MDGEKKVHWRSWSKLCRAKRDGGMGFRRLINFNRAMLAKQAWRLITNSDSLTARLLKARYFPRTDLLRSSVGHNPSYSWRSIQAGLSLLSPGLEWRIGNGRDINIWTDRWLPNSETGSPQYRYPGADLFQQVSELMVPGTHEWDDAFLRAIFTAEDAARIRAIHLSPRSHLDTIRWEHTESGLYTVKSGYYQDFYQWWNSSGCPTTNAPDASLWALCWKSRGPPRLKLFLWRMIDNNLPVRCNLTKRGMAVDSTCPLCLSSMETVCHLFLECPKSTSILTSMGCSFNLSGQTSMGDFLSTSVLKLPDAQRLRWLACFWGIWKIRNLHVFGSPTENDICKEMESAVRFGEEFLSVTEVETPSSNRIRSWLPPMDGWFKVNTDAGFSQDGTGQIAAIARDQFGSFICALIRKVPFVRHPLILEAMAVLMGIQMARHQQLQRVMFESDCQPLVLRLNSAVEDRNDVSIVVKDCLAEIVSFVDYRFVFARREANVPAHSLTKLSFPVSSSELFFSEAPHEIVLALSLDNAVIAD